MHKPECSMCFVFERKDVRYVNLPAAGVGLKSKHILTLEVQSSCMRNYYAST